MTQPAADLEVVAARPLDAGLQPGPSAAPASATGLTPRGMPRGRVHQLDAIRGVLAIGVMVYHAIDGVPIGLGTYGVYAFFVLSGFALELVYGTDLEPGRFAVARVARLAPLWVLVVLLSSLRVHDVTPVRLALNLTGLFGFVTPGTTSLVMGGWSIGIEVVCYFVFIVVAWRRLPTTVLLALTIAALVLRTWFLSTSWDGDLSGSWATYTQAPTFLVFFLGGMVGARARLSGHWPFLVGCALVGVTLLTDEAGLASPLPVVLAIAGIGLAGAGTPWTGRPARIASALGDASYGTYLMHPLVVGAVGLLGLATPVLALAMHRWYEVPAGRAIRRLRTPTGRRSGTAAGSGTSAGRAEPAQDLVVEQPVRTHE